MLKVTERNFAFPFLSLSLKRGRQKGVCATIGILNGLYLDELTRRLRALKAFAAGGEKKLFKSGNFYRTSLICVVLEPDTMTVPPWGASLVFNINVYAQRFRAASVWRIFYIPYQKCWLGQTPDAARKCGQLWILIRWNFNLWIFPSFPNESRDKPRNVA